MKYLLSLFFVCSVYWNAIAQRRVFSNGAYYGPTILPSWQMMHCQQQAHRFGAWNNEALYAMDPTADGGFVLAGHSDALPGFPLFIVKTDANGTEQWHNSYQPAHFSETHSVKQTTDGGYIVAGYTETTNRRRECWILKLDPTGNFQWQKTFGGSSDDEAYCVSLTSDGGYIVSGTTRSIDGDVQGGAEGSDNYWILKLDNGGNLQWQKKLEADHIAYSIKQTTDGSYIIAGNSQTYANHSVPHPGDLNHLQGFNMIKLSASGNFVWQVTLGTYQFDAAFDIIESRDGNYVVAGYTDDYNALRGDNINGLVVKINPTGSILWQTEVDFTMTDEIKSIRQTADGGFIFCGYTVYPWNQDQHIEDPSDFWIGKLDAAGQLEWQGALPGERDGWALGVAQTADGGYAVAGRYWVPGNMALGTVANLDYLLIKLTPGCTMNQVSGHYKKKVYIPEAQHGRAAVSAANTDASPVLFTDSLNRKIISLISDGASPVVGDVTATTWVDVNTSPNYVRRHYEITPDINSENATATVKLFFSQQDFDAYNLLMPANRKLPASADDNAGIANFRIIKIAGAAANEDGLPESYSGTPVAIDPDDDNIVWNDDENVWEVTIDIAGFSGFFATDALNSSFALPVTFGPIAAFLKNGQLTVKWSTEKETNNAYFYVEASTDGKTFTAISDKILSQAKEGNSSVPLQYHFTPTYTGVFGVSMLFLFSLMSGRNRRPEKWVCLLAAVLIFSAIACNKSTSDLMNGSSEEVFVRIVQTDIDGKQTYSKIIKVVK